MRTIFDLIAKTLSGEKTYLVAIAIAVVTIAQALGWITPEVAQILFGLLGGTAVATLRAGIAKDGKK